jgi:SNF2 family DNA or RNA helicase
LMEALEDLEGHKVIVWACFRENYAMIAEALEKAGMQYAFLYGGMSDKERQLNLDLFCKDPNVNVLIANQKSAGLGINLVESDYSLYFSRNFSLEEDLQSEARNYRGGSEMHEKVTRVDLVCPHTIDSLVLKALLSKQNMAENILAYRKELLEGI